MFTFEIRINGALIGHIYGHNENIPTKDGDTNQPIIMDQWGRIVDGRHRLVKALLEGRTTIPVKKIPDGTQPTYYNT